MARSNRFKEADTGVLDLLDNDSIVGPITNDFINSSPMPESKDILYLDPDDFIPYANEKLRLKLHSGEERERLKESIQQNGIFNPILCHKKGDKYEILSGHNRVDICKELEIKVPCIVKDGITKDEADLIVIDTNLLNRQRSDYKPTNFAYILKVKFDAEKHQGISKGPEVTKHTGDKIGEEYGLSRKTIYRYIKLNDLVDIAKSVTDSGELQIKAAFELAFLPADIQTLIVNLLDEYTINEKVLHSLRMNLDDKHFTSNEDMIAFVKSQLSEKNSNPRKFDYRNIKKYLPKDIKDNEIEDYVIQAIKAYRGY